MDRFIMRALTPPLAVTSHTSLGVSPTMLSSPTYGRKRLIVSAEELAKHNTADDEWATIQDKSVHMKSHGGGAEQLMRTKERDGNIHFNDHEVHKTITADSESVLQKYVIGTLSLLPSTETTQRGIASIVQRKVYNITPYMKFHPGGAAELMRAMGRDCTTLFNEVHKWVNVESMLSKCVVGTLLPPSPETMQGNSTNKIEAIPKPGTNRDRIVHCCTVEDIREITHDTNLYTVKLPVGSSFTVPTGHHVAIRANIDGEDIERSYTPVLPLIGAQDDGNTLQLMIKLYNKGKMSQHLSSLKIGDEIIVTDPEGTFDASRLNSVTNVLLVAAGTGFTPMVKVIHDMESQGNNKKTTKLLFANKKEKDIPWRKELDQLAQSNDGFEIIHILSAADNSWKGLKGRIDGNMLREHLPSSSPDQNTLICICGPTPFTASISNALLDMEYPDECIHCFT